MYAQYTNLAKHPSMPCLLTWLKSASAGDLINTDEVIALIETDKVTIDVRYTASEPGVIKSISMAEGDTVTVGQVVAVVDNDPEAVKAAGGGGAAPKKEAVAPKKEADAPKKEAAPAEAKAPAVCAPAPLPNYVPTYDLCAVLMIGSRFQRNPLPGGGGGFSGLRATCSVRFRDP